MVAIITQLTKTLIFSICAYYGEICVYLLLFFTFAEWFPWEFPNRNITRPKIRIISLVLALCCYFASVRDYTYLLCIDL